MKTVKIKLDLKKKELDKLSAVAAEQNSTAEDVVSMLVFEAISDLLNEDREKLSIKVSIN